MKMNILYRISVDVDIRKDAFSNKNLLESTGPELFHHVKEDGRSELSI